MVTAGRGRRPWRLTLIGVFSIYYILLFGVQPFVLSLSQQTKHEMIMSELSSLIVVASIFGIIFLANFVIGYYVWAPKIRTKTVEDILSLNVLGKFFLAVSILFSVALIVIFGENLSEIVIANRKGDVEYSLPIVKALAQSANVLALLMVFAVRGGERVLAIFALCLTSVASTAIGDRSMLVMPVLVSIYCLYRRGTVGTLSIAILGVGTIMALVFMGITRSYVLYGQFSIPSFADALSRGINLITYDQFLLYLKVSLEQPIRGGEDFINGLFGIVPRSIWPEKPLLINPGAWLGYYAYGRTDLGFPFTAPGVWFANFGIIGLMIGGALSGIGVRYAENLIRLNRDLEGSVLYFYCLFAGVSTVLVTKVLFIYFIPLLALKLCTRRLLIAPN